MVRGGQRTQDDCENAVHRSQPSALRVIEQVLYHLAIHHQLRHLVPQQANCQGQALVVRWKLK
jgi:hypothetical protein